MKEPLPLCSASALQPTVGSDRKRYPTDPQTEMVVHMAVPEEKAAAPGCLGIRKAALDQGRVAAHSPVLDRGRVAAHKAAVLEDTAAKQKDTEHLHLALRIRSADSYIRSNSGDSDHIHSNS